MKFQEIKVREDNIRPDRHISTEKLDHEVHMAKSDLMSLGKDTMELLKLLQQYASDERGIPGWVASKITKAQDYINSVHKSLSYDAQDGSISEAPEDMNKDAIDNVNKQAQNETKATIRQSIGNIEKIMDMMVVDSPSDIIADIYHWCDHNNEEYAKIQAIGSGYYRSEVRAAGISETASAGSTSAGSIATVANPHITKYKGPLPKKQKPSDNALDMKNASIFGGPIKRK